MPQGFTFQNNTSLALFGTIILTAFLVPYLPVHYLKIMYTLSILIKDIIMWALPIFICFNIAFMLDSMKKQAALMIISIIFFEFISNSCSMLFGYFYAIACKIPVSTTLSAECDACLDPYFSLSQTIPKLWSCQNGVLFGIALGLLMAYVPKLRISVSIECFKKKVDFFFSQIIGRLIPIFIIGFVANSYHMGIFQNAMIYGKAIVLAFVGVMIYCIIIFFVAMGCSVPKAIQAFKNVLPAYVMALTTASSFATMPTTIACTIKNTKNPQFAQAIIPATTNIQQIGDCLFNAYLIFVVMDTFGAPTIGFVDWLYFVFWYVLARYAMPAMLGAAMFVLFPLYVSILGFTHEMLAVVLTINVLIDPLITCCNVLANSGLCIVFENFWGFVQKNISTRYRH